VAWIALTWGWRYAFVAGGALGLVWVVVWALFYRLPRDHRWLSAPELALIEADRTTVSDTRVPIGRLLRMREVWGCILARALTDPISYFFAFWTPKFLQQERGFSLADIGKYSWIPFFAGALGNLMGGALPAWLIRRGWSLNRARKTTMLTASCLMPVWCFLIVQVPDPAMALVFASAAMFCHNLWANITLPAELFPTHVVGTVSGFGGCVGGATGIVTQQAIGWAVQTVSFTPVFAACSVVHLTAFAGVSVLVGELGRVRNVDQGQTV
jgi:ACS family hexuronate transporter-like MFS transporter